MLNQKRPIASDCTSDRVCKKRMVQQSLPSAGLQSNPAVSDAILSLSDNTNASSAGTMESPPAIAKSPCPFTDEFFADVAHTIANTFPFEAFARVQSCSLQDVSHALSAVVLAPLRRPHLLIGDNLSVSEYSQILIAEWRARDLSRPGHAMDLGSQWFQSETGCCGEEKPPVARTQVNVDIWGGYISIEK